jgi:hypothetical protein
LNRRLLYVFLFVQGFFAIALIYVGTRAREGRKQDYLELTHRVAAGHATLDDFEKLKFMLPLDSDAERVRALLGLPDQTATSIELAVEKGKPHAGKFWIYYPEGADQHAIDREAAEKLSGGVKCLVVEFGEKTRADVVEIIHPLNTSR